MLTGVPVAAPAGAVPLFDAVGEPESIASESPIMRLFHQWVDVLDEIEAAYLAVKGQGMAAEDSVYEAHAPARLRIEEAIQAEPVTSLQDLAAKVVVLSGDGTWAVPDETVLECASLAGRDFDKLPRCLFETEADAA